VPSAFCADVVGTVLDLQQHPVSGVNIVVQDSTGKTVGQATTDATGQYKIGGLSPNTYDYTLSPGTGFKGGSAVSYLDNDGLTVNWKVSDTGDAVALAAQGSKQQIAGDPFGMSMPEFLSVVVLGVTVAGAGAVGGLAAAGEFNGSSSGPPPFIPPTSSSE
jgi:hypothetical protein